MKSNSKTIQPQPSPIRELLWIVYKWTLIGLCMYACYKVLHLVPDFHFGELLACTLITACFIFVIYSHKILKKKAEQPDFYDNTGLSFYHVMNLVFYAALHMFFIFDFTPEKTLYISNTVFSIIAGSTLPALYVIFFLVDNKAA